MSLATAKGPFSYLFIYFWIWVFKIFSVSIDTAVQIQTIHKIFDLQGSFLKTKTFVKVITLTGVRHRVCFCHTLIQKQQWFYKNVAFHPYHIKSTTINTLILSCWVSSLKLLKTLVYEAAKSFRFFCHHMSCTWAAADLVFHPVFSNYTHHFRLIMTHYPQTTAVWDMFFILGQLFILLYDLSTLLAPDVPPRQTLNQQS